MTILMRLFTLVASAGDLLAPTKRVGWRNFSRTDRREKLGIRIPAWQRAFTRVRAHPVFQSVSGYAAILRDGKLFFRYADGTEVPAMMGGDGNVATVRRAGMPSGSPSEIDPNVKVRYVDDLLVNMADREADMLKLLGGFNNFVFNNTKVEWVEDDVWNRRPKLGSGTILSGGTGTGTLTLAAGTNHRYPIGTILLNVTQGEHVRIEAHDSGGADVTVRRDIATAVDESSTAWDGDSDEVIAAGFAMNETDAWVARPNAIFDLPYNLAQIQHVACDVTYRRQETALYGLRGTDLDKISADTTAEQFVYLEGAAVHGVRQAGSSNIPATFGGLKDYITSANGAQVSDLSSAPLTRKDIDDMLQSLYYEVGAAKMARTIVTSAWGKRKISSFFSAAERLGPKATSAGVVIDSFNTDFGMISVMLHTALAKNEMFLINEEMNKIGHHGKYGLPHLEEATAVNSSGQTGPFKRRVFYADVSMVCKGVEGEGRIHSFSESS